jgi:hypothetical protein
MHRNDEVGAGRYVPRSELVAHLVPLAPWTRPDVHLATSRAAHWIAQDVLEHWRAYGVPHAYNALTGQYLGLVAEVRHVPAVGGMVLRLPKGVGWLTAAEVAELAYRGMHRGAVEEWEAKGLPLPQPARVTSARTTTVLQRAALAHLGA